MLPARGLGRQAVADGLETLDVAKIHAAALAALEGASGNNGVIKRAELFFAEAITPIEKTHRAARKDNVHLSEVHQTLDRRAAELTTANRKLKKGIVRRKTVEQGLKKSTGRFPQLVKESQLLQKRLRQLTHRLLAAQEKRRSKMSRELHDEIAQTLLGINVRLLTLKKEAATNTTGFKKEIASTQRLVENSVKTIRRFAHEFGNKHDA